MENASPQNSPGQSVVHAGRESLDRCLGNLTAGRQRLSGMSLSGRIRVLEQCLDGIAGVSEEWTEAACQAKGLLPESRERSEEVLAGPASALRQLQLFLHTMRQIDRSGRPELPASPVRHSDGRLGIRVTPCLGLYDPVLFPGFRATTWLQPHISEDNLEASLAPACDSLDDPGISLVLGAGNVSGIPATDMLTKLCVDNRAVLLKMNPVNEYLEPIFERAFAPLIESDLLRIISCDTGTAAAAVHDDRIDDIHITGSDETYNAIVWGSSAEEQERRRADNEPLVRKPISSELGNVTPWIVIPGSYSRGQLNFQADSIVTSITNNAAFNCIATRVIVTWKQWPEREPFLQRIEAGLAAVPQRVAYYPGAEHRFEEFCGMTPEDAQRLLVERSSEGASATTTTADGTTQFVAGNGCREGTLPWVLFRNVDPDSDSPLFASESFACICAEVPIDAASPEEFLHKATGFCNEKLWGTLAASITVPRSFRRNDRSRRVLDECVDRLRYGVVSQNQWSGVVFALMSPPWGGYPDSTPQNIQSGLGWVHNSLMLTGIEKTILEAPLVVMPKAVWLASHPDPEPITWSLCRLFRDPSVWNLNNLAFQSVKGGLV